MTPEYWIVTVWSNNHNKYMQTVIKGSLSSYCMNYGEKEPIVFATPANEAMYAIWDARQ